MCGTDYHSGGKYIYVFQILTVTTDEVSYLKFWKKWSFVILLILCGAGVLTVTESWQGVADPAYGIGSWVLTAGANMGTLLSGDWGKKRIEELTEDNTNEDSVKGEMAGEEKAEQESAGQYQKPLPCETAGAPQEGVIAGDSSEDAREEVTYRDPWEVVYTAVEDDYFSDALFIGDSRTVGMFEYGGLENTATFYASTGLTIFKLFDSEIVPVADSKEKITVEQALSENQFKKIYLMVGINEMGRGDLEGFLAKYSEVITHLKELQPEAIIYLQGIMKVTTERSGKGDYISNAGIEERNAGIAALADNVKVYYLDVNPVFCDEMGGMDPSYTTDGVHLMAQYIPIWKEFLKQHAVVLD